MKNKRLFTYVFLFGLLVNGSACGSDHNETDFPETPGGETPPSPSGLQAYMLTTTDTRTYDLRESTVEFEPQASKHPTESTADLPNYAGIRSGTYRIISFLPKTNETGRSDSIPQKNLFAN